MKITLAIVFTASLLVLESALDAQVVSTFGSDDEGWRVAGDNRSAWLASFGNPAPCYDVNDLVRGNVNLAVAPAQFLGDWSSFSATETLSTDIFFSNTSGGAPYFGTYVFRIAGPGGAARAIDPRVNYPIGGKWNTYSVTLNPTQWTLEWGSWTNLMAAVTSLRVLSEYVNGDEIVRLDNVRLSRTPGYRFVPNLVSKFDTDLDDWSFVGTTAVAFLPAEGNSGGCARIQTSPSGSSRASAPAGFLGDWSTLDGVGHLGIDLRIISTNGTAFGSIAFLQLSGPGGSAYFSLGSPEFPMGARTWKRFRAPLTSGGWTVQTGSWQALLRDVRTCDVNLDLAQGGGVLAIDNFQRALDTEPNPDDDVRIVAPGIGGGAWAGFVGPLAVAREPRSGIVFGVVDDSIANGGGLWVLGGFRLWALVDASNAIFDCDGNAFVARTLPGDILRREVSGAVGTWVTGFHPGDDDPRGLAFAPVGFNGTNVTASAIIVTDAGYNNSVDDVWTFSRHVPEGEVRLLPSPGSVDLVDVACFADGRAFLADALNGSRILQLRANGTTHALMLAPPLGDIRSLVADDVTGALFATDVSSNTVVRIDAVSGVTVPIASGFRGLSGGCGIEIDVVGRKLFVADKVGNRVYSFVLPSASRAPAVLAFGSCCSNPAISVCPIGNDTPWLGHTFGVEISHLPPSTAAALLLGSSATSWGGLRLPFDLSILGMTNCTLLTGPELTIPLTPLSTAAVVGLTIPPDPGLAGQDFFLQPLATHPNANPLGLVTGQGLGARIGIR